MGLILIGIALTLSNRAYRNHGMALAILGLVVAMTNSSMLMYLIIVYAVGYWYVYGNK
jgi:hypothetical protein